MCEEVRAVARTDGVDVSADVVNFIVQGIAGTDPEGRSSLFRDLAQGRDSELEVLLGDVVRRADAATVQVPAMRAVYAATRMRYGVDIPGARPGDPESTRVLTATLSGTPPQ
jgi:ketopantoate reductase